MDPLCEKYQKYLTKFCASGSSEAQERLIFPSHCAQRDYIYDKDKHYSHSFHFNEENPNANKVTEMKTQYQTPAVSNMKDKIGHFEISSLWNGIKCVDYLQHKFEEL